MISRRYDFVFGHMDLVGCFGISGPLRQYFSLYQAVDIWKYDKSVWYFSMFYATFTKGNCIAQSVGHLTRKSGALGSRPGLATYFRVSFVSRVSFFKKGSSQLLAKVCARSTG